MQRDSLLADVAAAKASVEMNFSYLLINTIMCHFQRITPSRHRKHASAGRVTTCFSALKAVPA